MGVFPRRVAGARSLLADSARIAVLGGAQRLIVKTETEAHRIPTVAENLAALHRGRRLGGARPARHRSAGPPRGRLLAGPRRGPHPRAGRAGALPRCGPGAGAGVRVRDARRAVLPARRQRGPEPGRDRRRRSPVLGARGPDAGADPRGQARGGGDVRRPPADVEPHRGTPRPSGPHAFGRHGGRRGPRPRSRAARSRVRERAGPDRCGGFRAARAVGAGAARRPGRPGARRSRRRGLADRRRRDRLRPHLAHRPVHVAVDEHRRQRGHDVLRSPGRRPGPGRRGAVAGPVVGRRRPGGRRSGRLRPARGLRPLPALRPGRRGTHRARPRHGPPGPRPGRGRREHRRQAPVGTGVGAAGGRAAPARSTGPC